MISKIEAGSDQNENSLVKTKKYSQIMVLNNAGTKIVREQTLNRNMTPLSVALESEAVLLVDLKKIKKDALYKPLLRKFRNFLRMQMESFDLPKTCHFWSVKIMRNCVWDFMLKLELPPKFMTHKCLAMMILLVFPAILKK